MTTRRALTPTEKSIVRERQGGLCGCGCKRLLAEHPHDFDHELEVWEFGPEADPAEVNALSNFRALVKKPCHQAKTARKAKERAKVRRNAKKHAGTFKKSPSRWGNRKLESRSSFDQWLNMRGEKKTKKKT
jgi:hypothetical protein